MPTHRNPATARASTNQPSQSKRASRCSTRFSHTKGAKSNRMPGACAEHLRLHRAIDLRCSSSAPFMPGYRELPAERGSVSCSSHGRNSRRSLPMSLPSLRWTRSGHARATIRTTTSARTGPRRQFAHRTRPGQSCRSAGHCHRRGAHPPHIHVPLCARSPRSARFPCLSCPSRPG